MFFRAEPDNVAPIEDTVPNATNALEPHSPTCCADQCESQGPWPCSSERSPDVYPEPYFSVCTAIIRSLSTFTRDVPRTPRLSTYTFSALPRKCGPHCLFDCWQKNRLQVWPIGRLLKQGHTRPTKGTPTSWPCTSGRARKELYSFDIFNLRKASFTSAWAKRNPANLDSYTGSSSSFAKATSTRLRPSEVTKLTPGGSKKCRLLTLASILTLSPNTPSSPKFLACAAIQFRGIDVPHLSQPSQRGEIPQWSLATRFWTHNENWPSWVRRRGSAAAWQKPLDFLLPPLVT